MPHINRIRVNNVKYNFGTQYYDDFVMRFSGKNTIYDLANGGGKSVLMMLLFQNMLPNCTLDEKQPIEKLFRSGNGNQTIHSLVEWNLNPCDVKNGFKYMTTGFCARKGRESEGSEEDVKDTASIEYFNYCILYREFNDNDIRNLPLNDGKERITYQGLKNHLRELDKKDYNLQIHIFDRKGEYQRFISQYGIYESEWEIIRGINKTEGHVRTYFETAYRTTRKIVEDLLIEEIIQKSFLNRTSSGQEGGEMARTLLDIKDKLMELSKRKNDLKNYDHQAEILQNFIGRIKVLKGTYQTRDGLHTRLSQAYRSCLAQIENRKKAADKCNQDIENLQKDITERNYRIEAAKVQIEEQKLKEAETNVQRLLERQTVLEEALKSKKEELSIKESANDYFDYLENQKAFESAKAALEAVEENHEAVLKELYAMAALMKDVMGRKAAEAGKQQDKAAKNIALYQKQLELYKEQVREAEKQLAVWENERQRLSDKNEKSEELVNELRKGVSILVLSSLPAEQKKKQAQLEQLKNSLKNARDEIEGTKESITKQNLEIESRRYREQTAREQIDKLREEIKDYQFRKERIDKMKTIYQAKEYGELKESVANRYRQALEQISTVKAEKTAITDEIESLHRSSPIGKPEAVANLMNYIKRHHNCGVFYGEDYLKELDDENRENYLSLYPYLPYALLVTDHMDEILADTKLQEKELGNFTMPIILLNAVEKEKDILDEQYLGFAVKDKALFLSGKKQEERCRNLLEKQDEAEKKLQRLEESGQIIADDLSFLQVFLEGYYQSYNNKQDEYDSYRKYIRSFEEKQSALIKESGDKKSNLENLLKDAENQKRKIEELTVELSKMASLQDICTDIEKKQNQIKGLAEAIEKKRKEYESSKSKILYTQDQLRTEKDRNRVLEQSLEAMSREWETVYSPYYKEGISPAGTYKADSVEVIFKGKKEAFEQKNADITDKQKLASTYENAAKRYLENITYRGISIEKLQKMETEGRIAYTSREQLTAIKDQADKEDREIQATKKELDSCLEKKNKLAGAILHARNGIQEKYNKFEEINIESKQLPAFIEENKAEAASLHNELRQLEQSANEQLSRLYSLEAMQEDMQRMIDQEKCTLHSEAPLLKEQHDLKKVYRQIKEDYEAVKKESYQRREVFERDKAKMAETLSKAGALDLAGEITRSVHTPENGAEAERQIKSLEESIACIDLEKNRIQKSIADMEKIKENFESQCLQHCIHIKGELDRLSKLSKISLDDQIISIITLKIPYIKEELYKEAMAKHIDRIVENADTFQSVQERLKYIRAQLSWKRLFGVIVTDMDAIRLNLYKRERIKEQSRYLKYEEAVGSTGQSQGIYIQFLVAIVNYIASIQSPNADPMDLKKVLFIDNPFGAAKDVYIWEPIFKLLKSNHVQLVVPARGATPAITGRFEVNYILGQKLIGKRQQTVVVDYRSQTEGEELEYLPVSFAQETLVFGD